MKNNNVNRIIIASFIASVLLLFSIFFKTEKSKIHALLSSVEKTVTLEGNEQLIEKLTRVAKLQQNLSPNLELIFNTEDYKNYQASGKEELKTRLIAAANALKTFEVSFKDLQIELDQQTANLTFTISILGSLKAEEGKFFELHKVKATLIKDNSNWLLLRAEQLENLRE